MNDKIKWNFEMIYYNNDNEINNKNVVIKM